MKGENKLVSCSDYVINQSGWYESNVRLSYYDFNQTVLKYANFLKQPLTLGMFIPCDLEGNVLDKPKIKNYKITKDDLSNLKFEHDEYQNDLAQYQEAKDRVLFEGQSVVQKENSMFYRFQMENIEGTDRLVMRMVLNNEESHYNEKIHLDKYKTIEDLTDLGLTLTQNAIKIK